MSSLVGGSLTRQVGGDQIDRLCSPSSECPTDRPTRLLWSYGEHANWSDVLPGIDSTGRRGA